jgi:biotin carboxylase
VIIEVNSRMAGGFIPELVRRATGIDLIRELTRRVLGNEPRLEHSAAGHASIRFLVPERGGTLTSLSGEDEARAVAEVCDLSLYREPGFAVALAGDFHDRIGHVMTASHDPASARSSADHALGLLTVALA